MKASELRLGNYIQVNNGSNYTGIGTVATMSNTGEENDVAYYDNNGLYEYTDLRLFQPVPLTEEWLIKFGFEAYSTHVNYIELQIKSNKPSNHVVIRYGLQRDYFNIFNHSECDFTEMQYLTEVKFVHQLQNLYFALTGEELTIKEEIGTTI